MSHWTGDFGQLENAQHSRSNGSAHTLCYGPNTTPTLNQACIGQQGKNKHNRNPNVDANGNENGNVPQHTQQHTEPHYATPQQPQSAAVKFYELQTQQQEQEQQQQQAPQYKTHPIEPVPYYLGALQISGNTARPEHIGYNCGFGANNNNTPKPTPRKRKIPKLVLNPLCKVSRSSLSPEETRTYTPHSWLEPEAKSVSPPTGLNAAIEIGAGSVPSEHHFTPEQKKPEGQEEEEIEQNRPWLDDKDAQLPTLGDLLVDLWPEHDKDPYTTEQGEEAEDDDFIEVLEPTDCAYTVPPPNISVTSNEKSQKIIEEISDSDSDSDSDSGSASASGSVSDPTSDPASDPNSDPNSDPTSDSNSDLDDSVLVEISDSDQEESPPKSSALSSKAGEQEQKEAQSLSNEPPIYTLTHHDNGKKEEAYPSVSTDTVEDNIVLHTLELPAEGPQLAVEQNLQSRQPTAGEEHPATEQQPETETEALSLELAVLVANVDISQPDEKVPDQKPKKHLVETIYLTLHVIGATIKRIRSPPSKHHLKEIVHCKEKLFELWKQLILVSEPELSAEQLTPLIALHRDIEHIERLEGDSMGLNLLNKLRNILKGWTHPKDEIGATGDEAQSLRNEAAANAGTQGLGNRTDRKRSGGKLENSRAVSKYRCVESNFPSIISHPIADDMPTTSASSSMAEQHQASGPVSVSRLQIPSAGNKRLSIFNEPRTAPQIVRYHGLGNNQIDLSDDDEPPVNGSIFQSFASGRTTASSTEWGLNGQSSSHGNAAAAAAAGAAATSSLVRPSMLYADAVRLGQNGYSEQPHTSMNGHGHGHGHHPHHSHALRGSHNHNESLLMHVERRSEREQYANFLSDVAFNEFRSNQTSRTNLPPLLPMTSWNAMLKKNMERTNAHTQHALADHSSQVQQAKGKIAKPIPPPPPTLLRHSVFYLNSSDSKSGSSSPPPPQLLSAQVSIKAAPQPVIIDLDSSSNEKPAAKSESDQQKRLQAMQKRFSESIFFSDDYEQKFREREQRERAEMDHQRELARIEAEKLTQERRRLEASFRWTILELNLGSYAFESATVAEETEAELEIEFIPISEAQQKELLDIVTGPDEAPLITKYGLTMLKKDIRTMTGLFWLNDEVINFYMNLLTERSQEKAGTLPSVYAMNTFFLPRLLKDGFNSVRRWTRKIDVISKDIIVVPVHCNGMHWCIAIIHLKNRTLFYYDSLGKPNNMALEALKNYIKEESLDKRKQPYDMSDFKIENILNGPQQTNGSDCGVFSCMTAEYICRDKPLTFSQEHMPYFRKKMILEIVHGKLWK